jgi:hypothetical protein
MTNAKNAWAPPRIRFLAPTAEIVGGKDLTHDPTYVTSPSSHNLSVTCFQVQLAMTNAKNTWAPPRIGFLAATAEIVGGKDLTHNPTYVTSPSSHSLCVTCFQVQSITTKCFTNQSIMRIMSSLFIKRKTKFVGSILP